MIAKLLQPILIPLAFIAGLLLMFFGYGLYDSWFAYPAIKKEALQGYVLQTSLTATQAELDEFKRQIGLQMIVQSQFETVLKHAQEVAGARLKKSEQERADYAKKLSIAKRKCHLDDGDIEWLLRPK